MTKHPSILYPMALLVGVLAVAGCGKPVSTLTVSGPDTLRVEQTGTFTASANEDAKPPVEYSWTFSNQETASGSTVTHTFYAPGTYTVNVTASNKGGKRSVSEQKQVYVYRPPVPAEIVSATANPMSPDTRTAVNFSGSAQGDTPITYRWDFGDGSTGSGASASHTYSRPGTYTATFTASNEAGSDSRTLTVNVRVYEAPYCATVTEMNAAFFERNSSTLTADARAALNENVQVLSDCPNTSVRIEAFAAPGERNAQQLSDDRARAVQEFYTGAGVTASRVTAMGMGRVQGVTSKKEGADQYRRADSIPVR